MTVPDLPTLLRQPGPILALAPMQEVTDLPFWRLMTRYGGADVYYTEYFRVYADLAARQTDPRFHHARTPPAGPSSRR